MLVHDRGYLIAAPPGGGFTFYRPDGTAIPASPALPAPGGTIVDCHDADITPETIVPPWYGERLDLDHAIYVCLANAARQDRQHSEESQKDPEIQEEPFRPRAWVVNPFDYFRGYYHQHADV